MVVYNLNVPGVIRSQALLFCIMPLFAIGASTLPTLLGYIVDQVDFYLILVHEFRLDVIGKSTRDRIGARGLGDCPNARIDI